MTTPTRSVLRYPGSKWRLADWIISHFPAHDAYCEPFFGSGAVFFNKTPCQLEVINDIDGDVSNLFCVIRERSKELAAAVEMTPWARTDFLQAYEPATDQLEQARRFLIRCWQGIGNKTGSANGWSVAVKQTGMTNIARWHQLPSRILAVVERLRMAHIENIPALELITRFRGSGALVYADPPYVMDSRNSGGRMYTCEMDESAHLELLAALNGYDGPVVLSGYTHPLYDEQLERWARRETSSHVQKGVRTECLWLNPAAASRVNGRLFE